jgi:hypothetical protein
MDDAVRDPARRQYAAHEDASATPPHSSLDEVTGNSLIQDVLDGPAEMRQSQATNHGVGEKRPILALLTALYVKRTLYTPARVSISIDQAAETKFQ